MEKSNTPYIAASFEEIGTPAINQHCKVGCPNTTHDPIGDIQI